MKITKKNLQDLIKEETFKILNEDRSEIGYVVAKALRNRDKEDIAGPPSPVGEAAQQLLDTLNGNAPGAGPRVETPEQRMMKVKQELNAHLTNFVDKQHLQNLTFDQLKTELETLTGQTPAAGPLPSAADEKAERKRLLAIIKDRNASLGARRAARAKLRAMGPPGYDPDQGSLTKESLTVKKFKYLIKEELTNLLQEKNWARDEEIDAKLDLAARMLSTAKSNSSLYHLKEAADALAVVTSRLQGRARPGGQLVAVLQAFAKIVQPKSTNPPA